MKTSAWLRGFAVAFACAVCAPTPAWAQSGAVDPDADQAEEVSADDEQAAWIKRLDEAAARLAAAQRQVDGLEGAKGRGAARRYPRGDAKEKYLDDLAAAQKELADAKEAMPELLEEARRAGVVPGVLDRYESMGAIADSDSDSDSEADSDFDSGPDSLANDAADDDDDDPDAEANSGAWR